jgi:diguanylate cyclase (GGDEF)-like protein
LMNVSKLYNDKKEIEQCVGTMQDITKEKELRREAKFDSLTMVYNRKTGEKKVKKILRNEADQTHTFIILDLDRFKHLNDVLGHQYGDRALIEVAEILKNHFYREDIIFRLGGDEFAVLAKGLSAEMMDKVLGSLLRKMNLSYENEYKKVQITVSAGVALYPEHGQSFSQLYEHADKALYHAKSEGRNRWSLSVGEGSDLS